MADIHIVDINMIIQQITVYVQSAHDHSNETYCTHWHTSTRALGIENTASRRLQACSSLCTQDAAPCLLLLFFLFCLGEPRLKNERMEFDDETQRQHMMSTLVWDELHSLCVPSEVPGRRGTGSAELGGLGRARAHARHRHVPRAVPGASQSASHQRGAPSWGAMINFHLLK